MKTDDLIRALAADTQAERPLAAVLLAGLVPALAFAVAMLWTTLGFRADLVQSLGDPVSVSRFVLTGALGLVGVRMALLLARPDGRGRARRWPLAAVGAVALGLLIWAYATTPADGRQMAAMGKTMLTCLVMIPLLSVLPVAAILMAQRRGATTAPALAGCLAGLGGAGLSAAVYALYCTEDSPLFYVTWYGAAIAMVTVVSTIAGARLLRW